MDSSTIEIKSLNHSYSVVVDNGLRKDTYRLINRYINNKISSYFIVTDDKVAPLYLDDVINSFPTDLSVKTYIVPHGENAKSFSQYEKVITAALKEQLDRRSMIIALGGGVVGDLAGFVAATYMRGIPFVQMPTTLLAHDSSVGGKVGINHHLGKNMIGAFHAPSLVLYDTECLLTLPEREWRSGFAEVMKHGLIADEEFIKWLETNITSFLDWDMNMLKEMLLRSIKVKAVIVEEDEKEQGIRAFLNFGHTLGHAIEAELGYGKITHGEAVAIGMDFALRLSERYYNVKLPYDSYKRMLQRLGYNNYIPEQLEITRLLQRMKADKKSYDKKINFVLLKEIGKPELITLSENILLEELKREVENKW